MYVKSYSELISLPTFEERLEYLMLYGKVCKETFGADRIFNQMFYNSSEWSYTTVGIIVRDNSCDLGIPERELHREYGDKIFVHHINPITIEDIKNHSDKLLDPNNLITTSYNTHYIIHYGSKNRDIKMEFNTERRRNDTCPWKH